VTHIDHLCPFRFFCSSSHTVNQCLLSVEIRILSIISPGAKTELIPVVPLSEGPEGLDILITSIYVMPLVDNNQTCVIAIHEGKRKVSFKFIDWFIFSF
jgi:hypothetical protein